MNNKIKIKIRKLKNSNIIIDKAYGFISRLRINLNKTMSDDEYLKIRYKENMGKTLNLNNPQTFNEKLQWLKLHNRNPMYTQLVDKNNVRDYVKEKVEDNILIPQYGVWGKFEDIDFEILPNQFVLKATHDCGSIFICKNKNEFDFNAANKKLSKALKRNYYYVGREWPYKNVQPRIIAEQYIEEAESNELKDYKFFCFDGKVKLVFVASDRFNSNEGTKFDFFDTKFNHLPIINGYPNSKKVIEKPVNFNKMINIAETLSKGIPHVRVDLYNANGKIYFGEMTFFHFGGMMPFEPEEWDFKLGEWINLEEIS